jgi:hypothetical protein
LDVIAAPGQLKRSVAVSVKAMNTPLRKMILLAIIALLSGGNLFAQPKADDSPLSYGLVIDRSGSLRDDMKYVVAARYNY